MGPLMYNGFKDLTEGKIKVSDEKEIEEVVAYERGSYR
jgi:hypothetical protein